MWVAEMRRLQEDASFEFRHHTFIGLKGWTLFFALRHNANLQNLVERGVTDPG